MDEGLVVGIHVGVGDVSGTSTPVVGIVLPDDGAEAEGMGKGTDTVVDVTKRRLWERVRRGDAKANKRNAHASRWG